MTGTFTRTATATSSVAKIAAVTRKVQADFLAILDSYGYFTEDYARKIISDVRHFLDEEVIDKVSFIWTTKYSNRVIETYRYSVVTGGDDMANDRSGGIPYRPDLANADFEVLITYNSRWTNMNTDDRAEVRAGLLLNWGTARNYDYSGGTWTAEKTYSKDGYGLARHRFVR